MNIVEENGRISWRMLYRNLIKFWNIIKNKDYDYPEIATDKNGFDAFKKYINHV